MYKHKRVNIQSTFNDTETSFSGLKSLATSTDKHYDEVDIKINVYPPNDTAMNLVSLVLSDPNI